MEQNFLYLEDWKFKAKEDKEWMTAKVPGCVHTDLLSNGKIVAPFEGTNERELQWIDKKDWEYETTFNVTEEFLLFSHADLIFEGLDTYADVYLNNKLILSADNMFRTWKRDVRDLLKLENNHLKVVFRSPINEDLPKLEKLGYPLPATNDHSEDGGLGDKKVSIFARKAPYHYGWDWGPRFVTSGIWKKVKLEGWSDYHIESLFIKQNQLSSEYAEVTAVVEIKAADIGQETIKLTIGEQEIVREVELQKGINQIEVDVKILNPKLWWCRGLGEQHTYTCKAELIKNSRVHSEKKVRTGLRTVRVVKEKDEQGKTFYFELNGVPVFIKGANHIPNDSFQTEVSYERYRHEIASAVESNMNMLRVWGGGIYEYDEFYELCDEYGILVWQDFMFACSMYPGDEAFLENVKYEAEQNIKRLRNHPSIVLWCGNNEIDAAWAHYDEDAGWGWKQQYTPEIREKMWSDYEKIFHDILPNEVTKHAPGAEYWPSSPMAEITGDKSQHSNSNSATGDIHYWDVWHGLKPFEEYTNHVGRFMSEYGFQSFPEEKTVRLFADKKEMELESEVMLWHQKNGRGNQLIKDYMDMYLKEPKDFPAFLYMSQILQAEGIKVAIEAHRRNKPYCMGTLYWQMNDCWPVASWSSMDYYGRWKALQYYTKKSYKDKSLSITATSDSTEIYAITDVLEPIQGTLHVQVLDFNGEQHFSKEQQIDVKANSSQLVASFSTKELLREQTPNNIVLYVTLTEQGEVIDSKEHYFSSLKDILLSVPTISVQEIQQGEYTEFVFETDVLAKNVWLDTDIEGIFTDNYFDIIPGIPKKVHFLARDSHGVKPFTATRQPKLSVQSMANFINL
ncbi:beta-mannosidase [Halalkalibacter urbisdiaboli]|uniref:beta-mannosidase n=1 Tax=Halalkalibacter urbisdiaboli TaxID=1960589 RepID=UPI000B43565F|nr:glycoside hydrolase family 2 protein [Halalkalibacter urbisdiaboli]